MHTTAEKRKWESARRGTILSWQCILKLMLVNLTIRKSLMKTILVYIENETNKKKTFQQYYLFRQ